MSMVGAPSAENFSESPGRPWQGEFAGQRIRQKSCTDIGNSGDQQMVSLNTQLGTDQLMYARKCHKSTERAPPQRSERTEPIAHTKHGYCLLTPAGPKNPILPRALGRIHRRVLPPSGES